MLAISYLVAATTMFAATLYLFFRLRLFLSTTSMLIAALLLIYGPAFLSYLLSSGEYAFLIQRMSGTAANMANPLWTKIKGSVQNFDAIFIAMNFSIALMYVSIIAGIEMVDRLIPKRIATLRVALTNWSAQRLRDDVGASPILFGAISSFALFMLFISLSEHHVTTIKDFFSASAGDGERIAFRLHYASSPNYPYRLILSAIAPMLVIWGILSGWLNRSWWLLLSAAFLFSAVAIGKFDTLSKAPPAFFLAQLMVATFLTFTNKITWRSALAAMCVVLLVLYATFRLVVETPSGLATLKFVYSRVFDAESESLLENFAAFPFVHPHMWGANIRPLASLMGLNYIPGYSLVAHTWHGSYDGTSPSLFIADAWVDFSYPGVIMFSLLAGAVCRSIDAIYLVRGKTVVSVAVLSATFIGVLTLLTTALNTALLSGGLMLAPILASLLEAAIRHFDWRQPSPVKPAAGE